MSYESVSLGWDRVNWSAKIWVCLAPPWTTGLRWLGWVGRSKMPKKIWHHIRMLPYRYFQVVNIRTKLATLFALFRGYDFFSFCSSDMLSTRVNILNYPIGFDQYMAQLWPFTMSQNRDSDPMTTIIPIFDFRFFSWPIFILRYHIFI